MITIVLYSCKTSIAVNAEIKDNPVLEVSLDEYANVQQRVGLGFQDPKLALGLSISGGGSRAEYYGLGALMGLQEIVSATDEDRNFLDDVDYFSTISGGGFAAGYYLGARKNGLIASGQSLRDFWLTQNTKYESNIPFNAKVGNLLSKYKRYEKDKKRPSFPDLVDKHILQKGKKNLQNQSIKSLTLNDFFMKDGDQAAMPMFVANGTIYNNSERIPFMPHIIRDMNVIKSEMPDENLSGVQYNDGYSLPLKYAIAASSGFPGLVPQVKFKVFYKHYPEDESEYFISIIDGGVVDNLGYATLIELLKSDHYVSNENKRALIIDCSGEGLVERYAPNKLGRIDLLKHSLMFTLQSKYATFETDIENKMRAAGIPNPQDQKNYLKIGITDLREVAQRIKDDADAISEEVKNINAQVKTINNKFLKGRFDDELLELSRNLDSLETEGIYTDANLKSYQILDSLREDAGMKMSKKQKKKRWDRFFDKFELMLAHRIKQYGLTLDNYTGDHYQMDLLKTADFAKFTEENDRALLLLLYELASQVDTNVEIPSNKERSILILAGRYTVFMRREKIMALYSI